MSRARHHEASMASSLAAAILVLGGVSVSAAQAKTVKVELTAKETSVPANNEGRTVVGWTYNGQIPGPLFRATEGDTIELTLKNDPSNALDRLSCGTHRCADLVRADQARRDEELHIYCR